MTEQTHVHAEVNNGVMEIRINRPERKNALTHAMYEAITAAMDEAAATPSIRVLLFAGTHDCFTAGNDMVDFLQNPPKGDNSPVMIFLRKLVEFEKPMVAAVNGPAVGVGTTMLFHCDMVVCARGARLQMPFTSLGLCPEAGSSLLLPMIIGHQRASQLLMLGDTIDGETAERFGIANLVCDDTDYLDVARQQCLRLAAQPAAALRLTKHLIKAPYIEQLRAHMRYEGDEFGKRLDSPEAREAMTAFMQKRKPDFSQFD